MDATTVMLIGLTIMFIGYFMEGLPAVFVMLVGSFLVLLPFLNIDWYDLIYWTVFTLILGSPLWAYLSYKIYKMTKGKYGRG